MSSAQAASTAFPAPIGGVPFNSDLAPSIVFVVAYAAVIPLGLYRIIQTKSRTLCTLSTVFFVVERLVTYSLRASAAHTRSQDTSRGLTRYWQSTYGIGYLSIFSSIAAIIHSLLVNATFGVPSAPASESDLDAEKDQPLVTQQTHSVPTEGDQPRARYWYRRICISLSLSSLITLILGIVSGVEYPSAESNPKTANAVEGLRYTTTGMAFIQILIFQGLSVWGYLRVPRISRSGALTMAVLCALLNVVSIYRLVVMHNKTPSLTSTGPGSLNSMTSKATFYIFHVLPEWLAATTLLAINVRQTFGTGMFGDYRLLDKKPAP
ncbi:hypothetical protein NM688_g7781 [Phlebia brevispora]|uniref:Uncharacterized protein n=1 Tax=Phlebia brevispora TaxID=194682 RepID=A0ACC1S173_9APHY|nr:hypothetical protein NM688_g7781 [Phlebia brevispora]